MSDSFSTIDDIVVKETFSTTDVFRIGRLVVISVPTKWSILITSSTAVTVNDVSSVKDSNAILFTVIDTGNLPSIVTSFPVATLFKLVGLFCKEGIS